MPRSRLLVVTAVLLTALLVESCVLKDSSPIAKVSFYFVAHQDDWQLFMNPSAFQDVADVTTKAVFIHITAGDDGSGTGTRGRKHPFYLARENGAESAMHFMADWNSQPITKIPFPMQFNGHSIYRLGYRNTVNYFLRVPDGNPMGSGYSNTGFQSLKRLANGEIDTLLAVDGSTVYRGWLDLVTTLRAILDFERGGAPLVQLNVPELDANINPRDHSDHLMTARAALQAAKGLACARRVYYVDYASAELPENLNPHERDMKTAVFAVTLAGVLAMDHEVAWHRYDQYMGKNYFRVEEGAGRCDINPSSFSPPSLGSPEGREPSSGGKRGTFSAAVRN
jgi:hypothetical protein